MAENERNQQQQPGDSSQQNQSSPSQNTSGQDSKDQNPQGRDHWNNYRTRELSDDDSQEGNDGTPERE